MFDFTGKRIVVTGGSRGIGAAVSRQFAEAGGSVIVNYLPVEKDEAGFKELAKSASAAKGEIIPFPGDISRPEMMEVLCSRAAGPEGTIDILINCAGFAIPVGMTEITPQQWRKGIDVNLSGAFYVSQAAVKRMLPGKKGRIIYIGSAGAITGGGGSAFYSAAKAGINGLVRALSKELSPLGITVNAVLPALIDTDLLRDREPDADKREEYVKRIPVGRFGTPDDVAFTVLFLASDYASYITGQHIIVDGGSTYK